MLVGRRGGALAPGAGRIWGDGPRSGPPMRVDKRAGARAARRRRLWWRNGRGGERATPALAPGVSTGDEPVGWRAWLVFMRVPASGCYALQVDGTSFSYAIAFEAAVP